MDFKEACQVDEIMAKVVSAVALLRTIHSSMDESSSVLDAIWGVANYLDYVVEEAEAILTPKEQ